MKNRIVIILSLLIFIVLSQNSYGSVEQDFTAANLKYEKKQYDSAITLYQNALNKGAESAALYFNLGNAYFKQGDLGHAILNYKRAIRLNPADDDIISNLEFARNFTRVQMEGVKLNPLSSFFESLVATYRLSDMAWVSSLIFIFFMVLMIIRFGLGFKNAWLRIFITNLLIVLFIVTGLTTYKYHNNYIIRRAVIISEESTIYSGPSDKSEVELDGAPGLVVEILSESSEHYNVLFENKRRGWIKKELVAEI